MLNATKKPLADISMICYLNCSNSIHGALAPVKGVTKNTQINGSADRVRDHDERLSSDERGVGKTRSKSASP